MTARADSKVVSAADEGVKLTRSLGRIDLIFFTIGATFALGCGGSRTRCGSAGPWPSLRPRRGTGSSAR